MSFHQYLNQKQEIHKTFIDFIESDDDESFLFREDSQIQENREELLFLLKLISKIANNHKRSPKFFQKNQQILLHYKNAILRLLSNYEIANIFKRNIRILLFLLEEKFIFMDKYVFRIVNRYPEYFSPEIEEFEGKNKSISKNDQLLFEEKRKKGENDNYLYQIIREDLIEDFISHVTMTNLKLDSYIKSSIFETNNLLLKNIPTLIQYSAFYGSIQIFRFLIHNEIELTPSIWPYAIHGRNPELIHLIEENKINPESYEQILIESIKCHHLEISEYFYNNFIQNPENNRNIQLAGLKYYNLEYFPQNINNDFWFYYLCKHNYIALVKLLLKAGNIDINRRLVLNPIFF